MEVNILVLRMIDITNVDINYITLRKSKSFFMKKEFHPAIKNLNLKIKEGEVVAVLGHNGAGKTTLLNFIAGKIRPATGRAEIIGDTIHLAGINPGFDSTLTSRENIRWLSKIYKIDPDIIEIDVEKFSDLAESFDRPVKELSGGMKGRVGFGFATSLNPDILLIDEVLGVGDPSFKNKATKRLKEMIKTTGIVIISTHSVGLVKELATRTIVLQRGQIIHDGDVPTGIELYTSLHNK